MLKKPKAKRKTEHIALHSMKISTITSLKTEYW